MSLPKTRKKARKLAFQRKLPLSPKAPFRRWYRCYVTQMGCCSRSKSRRKRSARGKERGSWYHVLRTDSLTQTPTFNNRSRRVSIWYRPISSFFPLSLHSSLISSRSAHINRYAQPYRRRRKKLDAKVSQERRSANIAFIRSLMKFSAWPG